MIVRKNFSGDQTNQVLITKGSSHTGRVKKIHIANTHASATQTTTLDLYDGTNTYILYNQIDIPAKTVLILTDNVGFDSFIYNLRLTTTGSSSCHITIT